MKKASYLTCHESGELQKRIEQAHQQLSSCTLCPRHCKKNRLGGETGVCKTGESAFISSYNPHFGEEAPLVGSGGSGTIFFTHCNLHCIFCQNYQISHLGEGIKATSGQLAAIMVSLQKQGCHNINFVTPSHVVPQILAALPQAIENGLTIPLVYNSSGYDEVETLRLLDGIVDIYMPDFKFWHEETAKQMCKAPDYPQKAREAIREMHRQVGDLVINTKGVAENGLLVRHLVMPGQLDETEEILTFLADEISPDTYVNVMDQYRPCYKAREFPGIDRSLDGEEYQQAIKYARQAGLTRLDSKDWDRFFQSLGIV